MNMKYEDGFVRFHLGCASCRLPTIIKLLASYAYYGRIPPRNKLTYNKLLLSLLNSGVVILCGFQTASLVNTRSYCNTGQETAENNKLD